MCPSFLPPPLSLSLLDNLRLIICPWRLSSSPSLCFLCCLRQRERERESCRGSPHFVALLLRTIIILRRYFPPGSLNGFYFVIAFRSPCIVFQLTVHFHFPSHRERGTLHVAWSQEFLFIPLVPSKSSLHVTGGRRRPIQRTTMQSF